MTMKNAIITIVALAGILAPASARAQLLIEEGKVNLTVDPGQTIVNSLLVHNTSAEAFHVKVYWQDFKYKEPYDGKKDFLPSGSAPDSMAGWITFSPQEFDLPAYSKQKVTYTLKVPGEVKGGHYGVLFFEKGSLEKDKRTGVRVVTRVGCLFFTEARDRNKGGKIEALSLQGAALTGVFRNAGDVIVLAQGIYYIMDKEGMVIDRGELSRFYLPPAAKADFKLELPENLASGKYTLVLTFDLEEGDTLVKEVDLEKTDQNTIRLLQERD